MISKLLLVRQSEIDSTLVERAGCSAFVVGDPLKISPISWGDEDGLSHYGFVLQKMKLDDLKELEKWIAKNGSEGVSLHEFDESVDKSIANVGLRINKSA